MALTNKKCPRCGNEVSASAPFCAQCGLSLAPSMSDTSLYACEDCETPLPGGSRFCPGCGLAFDEPVPLTTPQPTPGFRQVTPPAEPVIPQPSVPLAFSMQISLPGRAKTGPRVNYGWIGEAFRLFLKAPGVWVASVLLPMLPSLIYYLVAAAIIIPSSHSEDGGQGAILLFKVASPLLLLFLFWPLVMLSYTTSVMANKQARGLPISTADLFKSRPQMWTMLGLNIISLLLVCLGMVAFYVGAIVVIAFVYPAMALVADGIGVGEALSRSFNAIKKDWLNAVLFTLLWFLLVNLVVAASCGLALLVALPLVNIIPALIYRDMIGMPPIQNADSPVLDYLPETHPVPEASEFTAVSPLSTPTASPATDYSPAKAGLRAQKGRVLIIGALLALALFASGAWLIGRSRPSVPTDASASNLPLASQNSPEVAPSAPVALSPVTTAPVHWGNYTVTGTKSIDADGARNQTVCIRNAAGVVLWKLDGFQTIEVEPCHILDATSDDLEVVAGSGGSSGAGVNFFFSRLSGLRLLFSYGFGDSDDITGFARLDNSSRPEVRVDHSIVDFDDLPHAGRPVFRCVYTWDGSNYVNTTIKFPKDAQEAENEAQANYLHDWQGNPNADYNEYKTSAFEYWANAMAIGQGDVAKQWLLTHSTPAFASHLLLIEDDLQKRIPYEGARLDVEMGDGANLDQPVANSLDNVSDVPTSSILTDNSSDTMGAYAPAGSGLDDTPMSNNALQNQRLTQDNLKTKSLRALSISHSTIYALHGYVFSRPAIQSYFASQPWYHSNPAFSEALLSSVEQENAQTIRAVERSRFGYGRKLFDAEGKPYEQRDPLQETASQGSGLNDTMLDLDTLQHGHVTTEELSDKSLAALSVSYNAIYAAHGYVFSRPSLRNLFQKFSWYKPNSAFSESSLSETEKANLQTIRAYERIRFNF